MIVSKWNVFGKGIVGLALGCGLGAWYFSYDHACGSTLHGWLAVAGNIATAVAGLISAFMWRRAADWYGTVNAPSDFAAVDERLRRTALLIPLRPTRYPIHPTDFALLARNGPPTYRDLALRTYSRYLSSMCWVVILFIVASTSFACALSTSPSLLKLERVLANPGLRLAFEGASVFGLYQAYVNVWLSLLLRLKPPTRLGNYV